MKAGQIANKKVISTFVCCMCFLLVLYCSLSQINIRINESSLKASAYDIETKRIEAENVLDANILISKEEGLKQIEFAAVSGYGNIALEYSKAYNITSAPLTASRGAIYFDGHKETYYSERVLPGTALNIPGRHVADDGTIRDIDGYISVAADSSYMARGTILMTSLGPAKVYDTGCAYGTIDIYVNW